ncbi:MAG: prepilin-type N-terminal cleavage/methylation domain-containing protein [Deltaproteobacteria bacterium]|jgi:prepilin-type N-terminal cleavage/methylation domain-containing protein|nr:prepilin-type N-terminal cleavage/methylation domain-containing protein [Deltaproteobacteria bacterium]
MATRAGFTILELLVALGIIAIISAIAYPAFSKYQASTKVRTEARTLDSTFQKARMLAAITQKPIRVVVNCAKANAPSCVVNLQTPIYVGINVNGWKNDPDYRRVYDERVWAEIVGSPLTPDGETEYPSVYWAIFMPNSRVFSNPKPFKLFFRDPAATGPDVAGWTVSLSVDSGRCVTKKEVITI